ncbi:hypothetical protein [Methanoculleus bourgensis]|uniref:hypothetical protein n=1 Tax=Methanoculleus bourgensis TaxID=83986 RepID=UPI0015D29B76|nr:hypothetical protein [Methanoculleus bourgensis]
MAEDASRAQVFPTGGHSRILWHMFCTYGREEMKRFDNREERTPKELSFRTINISLLVFRQNRAYRLETDKYSPNKEKTYHYAALPA